MDMRGHDTVVRQVPRSNAAKRSKAIRLGLSALSASMIVLCLCTGHAQALAYNGSPTPSQVDRFSAGFETANPLLNSSPSYIGQNYDLSGVGWLAGTGVSDNYPAERVHSLTMISPLNFAVAQHYSPGFFNYGTPLDFVNTSGNLITMTAALLSTPSVPNYTADFAIGTMTQAFTSNQNVAVYRLLDVASYNYGGMPLVVYGSEINNAGPTIGTASIASGNSYATPLAWNPGTGTTGAAYWEGGDSGSPAFITYMAPANTTPQLTFAGTAWYPNSLNSYLANPNAASGPYNPVTTVNNVLKTDGYALRWTIYVNAADPAQSAPVWTGAAESADLGAAGNWSNATVPSDVPVVFNADQANGQTLLTLGGALSWRGLLFQATASPAGFTLGGKGSLTMGYSGIRNESAATQTFNVPMALSDSQNWEAVAGDLVFNGSVNTGNGNLVVIGGSRNTAINGIISGSGFIAKDGTGTLTLTASNTYTGNTVVHNGTLDLSGSGALLPGTNLLFIGGNGALIINGQSQSFSGILSEYGGTGQIVLNGGSVTDVTTLDGATPFAGTISGNGTFYKNQTGILNLTGADTQTGTLQINRGIIRLSSAAALPTTSNLVINANDTSAVELGASNFTEALGMGAGQLRFIGSGNAGFGAYGGNRTINLAGAGATVTWADGYFANANINLILATNTSTGTLNFENGINLNGAARTFVVDNGSAAIDAELSGVLRNSGLTKTGADTLELTAANTYSGATTIEGGALLIGAGAALPANSNVVLNGGVLELGAGNFNEALGTGTGQLQFAGNGGFAAYGGNRTVNLGGAGATVTWSGTAGFLQNGQELILSAPSAVGTVIFENPLVLGVGAAQVRTIYVNRGSTADGIDAIMAGAVTAATSPQGLIKAGPGTLELQGLNNYGGPTTISDGTLLVTGELNGGTPVDIQGFGTLVYNNTSVALADDVTVAGGVYYYNSPAAYAGTLTIASGTIGGTGNLADAAVTLATGGCIAPGYMAPGTLTTGTEIWAGGGRYLWQINNLSGAAGLASGWDLLKVNGALTLAATSDHQFIIRISSVSALAGWNPNVGYVWTILTASHLITGLNTSEIYLDPTNFAQWNALGAGSFSVQLSGEKLNLVFSPRSVPEPAELVPFMTGIGTLLWFRRGTRERLSKAHKKG